MDKRDSEDSGSLTGMRCAVVSRTSGIILIIGCCFAKWFSDRDLLLLRSGHAHAARSAHRDLRCTSHRQPERATTAHTFSALEQASLQCMVRVVGA